MTFSATTASAMTTTDLPCLTKPVLITGASAGIGLACAQALVQAGARHLILTARDLDHLQTAQAQLQSLADVRVDIQVCDHSNRDDLERLLSQLNAHGWPGTLIANVGVNPVHEYGPKKIHSLGFDQIHAAVTTNITHTLYLLGVVLKNMRSARDGRILLIGSQGWHHGIPGQALYNLCKSSLVGLKNSVVSEYGGSGIFCHLLNPGLVLNERTLRLRQQHPQLATQQGVTEIEVAQAALKLLMLNDPADNGQEQNI